MYAVDILFAKHGSELSDDSRTMRANNKLDCAIVCESVFYDLHNNEQIVTALAVFRCNDFDRMKKLALPTIY